MKLLGRKIGYKALETRLKQMWVCSEIINIIDLGNEYYLVAFSHEDDKNAALSEGPWFICDHYLTVKDWNQISIQNATQSKKLLFELK